MAIELREYNLPLYGTWLDQAKQIGNPADPIAYSDFIDLFQAGIRVTRPVSIDPVAMETRIQIEADTTFHNGLGAALQAFLNDPREMRDIGLAIASKARLKAERLRRLGGP